LIGLHIEEADLGQVFRRGERCLNSYPLITPISRHLANLHEALLFSSCGKCWIWAKARESLAKTSLQIRGEVTDAEIFGRTVESVPSPGIVEIICSRRIGKDDRVRSSPYLPYPDPGGLTIFSPIRLKGL